MRSYLLLLILSVSTSTWATSDLFIYPKNGQNSEQQGQDRYECHVWAVQQTGFDPSRYQPPAPVHLATAGGPPIYPAHHHDIDPVTGAASGAALGAVGGAIAGNAGKGAAIGAGVGALAGIFQQAGYHAREKERREFEAQQQATLQAWQAAEQEQLRFDYNRAIGACLEARGYTVK